MPRATCVCRLPNFYVYYAIAHAHTHTSICSKKSLQSLRNFADQLYCSPRCNRIGSNTSAQPTSTIKSGKCSMCSFISFLLHLYFERISSVVFAMVVVVAVYFFYCCYKFCKHGTTAYSLNVCSLLLVEFFFSNFNSLNLVLLLEKCQYIHTHITSNFLEPIDVFGLILLLLRKKIILYVWPITKEEIERRKKEWLWSWTGEQTLFSYTAHQYNRRILHMCEFDCFSFCCQYSSFHSFRFCCFLDFVLFHCAITQTSRYDRLVFFSSCCYNYRSCCYPFPLNLYPCTGFNRVYSWPHIIR